MCSRDAPVFEVSNFKVRRYRRCWPRRSRWPRPGPLAAPASLRVVTTTEDLASLAREIGGDRITVVGLAKGYQDPHQVDPKPSFILEVSRADVLIAVGRELEIGWLPALLSSSRNGKVQVGGPGYLDASQNVKILEIPTGQITRAMGDVHPQGNPHYWLDPANGRRMARRDPDASSAPSPRPRARTSRSATPTSTRASRPPKRGGTRSMAPFKGREARHLPSQLAELHGALGARGHRATSSRSRASRRRRRTSSASSMR